MLVLRSRVIKIIKEKTMLKKEVLQRINSRVTPEQKKFLKDEAKKLKIGEGELHRKIVDFYMNSKR